MCAAVLYVGKEARCSMLWKQKDIGRDLKALTKEGRWQEVSSALAEARSGAVELDIFLLGANTNALGRSTQWKAATGALRWAAKESLELSTPAWNALVSAAERAGSWVRSLSSFVSCGDGGLDCTMVSFNAVGSACAKGEEWQRLLRVLRDAGKAGLRLTAVSSGTTTASYDRPGGDWRRAFATASSSCLQGIPVGARLGTSLFGAAAKAAMWRECFASFRRMKQELIEHDIVSFSAAVAATEGLGLWQQASRLWTCLGHMGGLVPNVVTATSLCSCMEKAGRWKAAFAALTEATSRLVRPTAPTLASATSACEKGAQWRWAVELLERVAGYLALVSLSGCHAAASACIGGDQWHLASKLLTRMESLDCKKDLVTLNVALAASDEAATWQASLRMLHSAADHGQAVDAVSYGALLSAAELAGVWTTAFAAMTSMAVDGVLPGEVICFCALRSCKERQWLPVLEVLEVMRSAHCASTPTLSAAVLPVLERAGRPRDAPCFFFHLL
eukprot:TRINITY_DN45457_c0_g1_i1.p1 TRINITY_DN45457_c0_g1~~TRINITY_DN45457_c0_g1_i1.p1  ORF type:complete len:504 (-),score=80.08 TRINITY_DN45457_c0_g1_i1:27-1538(-)